MGISNLSEHVIFVDLPACEPYIVDELKELNEIVSSRGDCDVVIDFTHVDIFLSSSLSNLLILRDILHNKNHELVLSGVAFATKCIFTVVGLNEAFIFVEDKFEALDILSSVSKK
ncbi:MAG: STAS domain-containing protein [Planctomycetota bacterium]|jgi:anti-anti-sigma regulatory factor